MNKPAEHISPLDPDDIGFNTSGNEHIQDVLGARRSFLKGSAGAAVASLFGSLGLAACGGGSSTSEAAAAVVSSSSSAASSAAASSAAASSATTSLLGFTPVAKSLADVFTVPSGYTATVIYALGDPLSAATPAFKNDGTDSDFENRAGDCHDGMEYFGLSAAGLPDQSSSDRGLLAMNHEYINQTFLHASGPTSGTRPAAEVDKEVAAHGVSVVEIKKTGGKFATVQSSSFNRRVTGLTEIEIAGPAAGHALLKTKFSLDGKKTRGTLNNCGTGKTPWGTLLTGEENWSGYFKRASGDDALRDAKSVTSLNRYGRKQNTSSRYGWETAGADDKYARWNISVTGGSTDGSDDYRNELNGQGYITEIDPYSKSAVVRKRTALGRFNHEAAAVSKPVAGKPLAVYMGDDAQNEYVYKFVSAANWDAADANPLDRIATGDKYLNNGTLYVAKFNADGSGSWLELSLGNSTVKNYATYAFADLGDVVINARLAADAVGATKMDRPEWCSVNPANGEVYFTMTNNTSRTAATVDAANPRAYTDTKGASTTQNGNVNGHIIRIAESSANPAATSFKWDVYAFGAEATAAAGVNLSGLDDSNDFSSPDGLGFTQSSGICWIQTDDGAYTDVTNCMMLAALPGTVGDGGDVSVTSGSTTLTTKMGAKPGTKLKRFLVGPYDQEITGVCESPDGKTLFVNVQHPGEGSVVANIADPSKYTSQWPSNAGYGAGKRPRSATVMITRNDGGLIGS
ncbi:PhoX family protein [Uliginosibacterium aquaticum]|uniref:PhoX family phosphatase n=1 Tax=Uliginosibacterium aquaticum TaxID=2731212 RepID=A0ABX2ILZ9_9RHOO|nr:PhoX family phosphatase [Uliginosibacterium aquaticum]NSL55328.1 PhoX family phosphatase [Uliginosibacterium aquaticum]